MKELFYGEIIGRILPKKLINIMNNLSYMVWDSVWQEINLALVRLPRITSEP